MLAGVSAFSGLDRHQLALVAAVFVERHCAAGERLIDENERVQTFSVIAKGSVRVYLPAGGGSGHRPDDVALAELSAGEFFGEYSFIDLRHASATVEAKEPTVLLEVPYERLHHLLDVRAEIASRVYYNLLLTLIDRLRKDDRELDTFSFDWD